MNKNTRITPFIKQCFVTAAVDLTMLCCGTSIGFPAILLPQLRDPHSTIHLSKDTESWIASIGVLGMLLGLFLTPPMMDRLGRKKSLYCVFVLLITGYAIIFSAQVQALFISRVLHGIATGVMASLGNVLIGECASPKNRGAFLTTTIICETSGILLIHFLGSIFSWKTTALICISFPLVSLVISIYIPESPSWLLSKDRYDKFKNVFRWLRGEDDEEELKSMLQANSKPKEMKADRFGTSKNCYGNLKEIVVKKEFYKPIIIMVHCCNLLTFSVGFLLVIYPTIIIGAVMGPNTNAYSWTVLIDVLKIFANIIAIFVIHKFNRRAVLFTSGVICIFCNVVISCCLYAKFEGWLEQSSWVPLPFLIKETFTNGLGILPIRGVIAGELFPLKYRSIGGSISFTSSSIMMFTVLKTYPALINKLHIYGTYMLFTTILVYSFIIVLLMLPETKGRTLQQIEDDFKSEHKKNNKVTSKKVSHTTASLISSCP